MSVAFTDAGIAVGAFPKSLSDPPQSHYATPKFIPGFHLQPYSKSSQPVKEDAFHQILKDTLTEIGLPRFDSHIEGKVLAVVQDADPGGDFYTVVATQSQSGWQWIYYQSYEHKGIYYLGQVKYSTWPQPTYKIRALLQPDPGDQHEWYRHLQGSGAGLDSRAQAPPATPGSTNACS
jgi:hypothetical protein